MFLIQIQLAVYNIYSPDLSYSGFALSSWGYIPSYVLQFAINEKYCLFFLSRTVRVTKLKRATHMANGFMYCLYRNQGLGLIIFRVKSRDMFYNLPLIKKLIGFTIYNQ